MADTEIPIPVDATEINNNAAGGPSPAQEILRIDSENQDLIAIPPCTVCGAQIFLCTLLTVLQRNCLYPEFLQKGCTPKDYRCFCSKMSVILLNTDVQSRLKECLRQGEQLSKYELAQPALCLANWST